MPRLSIGLPVYNGARYLENALDSILGQTFKDFELIISDNASSDATESICRRFAEKDKRIRYCRNETNLGAAENFNRTFNLSTGKYFKWAAYDDVCAPEYFQRCFDILEKEPSVVLCYPKTILVDENCRKIRTYEDNLDLRQPRPHQRLKQFVSKVNLANAVFGVIRSDALRDTRLMGKFLAADYILLIEISLRGKFQEIPEYLFYRRDHTKNSRRLPRHDLAVWWDTTEPEKVISDKYKLIAEQLTSIARARLDWSEKMLCYFQVGRWILRQAKSKGGRYKSDLKRIFHLG